MFSRFFYHIFVCAWLFVFPLHGKLHFATATDTEHYTWTLNLIASIHRFHNESLGEIAVFDLGLTPEERAELTALEGVSVHAVEKVNPYIFEKFVVDDHGKIARGYYCWKPVVLKQASELFFEFFYLDSGVTLLGPMDLLFKHVHENGYFLIDCGHPIRRMTIKPLIKTFHLNEPKNKKILDQAGISAGIQGISKSLYTSYLVPLYKLAHEIDNFKDDGSCPKGFGWARHDQALFSIQARLLQLKVQEVIRGGKLTLKMNGKQTQARLSDFLKISRGDFDLKESKKYLRSKPK